MSLSEFRVCMCVSSTGGKFLIQGVKINTPHYLAKMEGIVKGTSTYTVVVSQLESLSTIYYTLRVCTYVALYIHS